MDGLKTTSIIDEKSDAPATNGTTKPSSSGVQNVTQQMIPDYVIGRCWKKYPPFIKTFFNKEEKEEDVYLEIAEMPSELHPRVTDVLPFNFADEAFVRNISQQKLNDKGEEEASFYDQIPFHYKHFFMSPHPIYAGGFYLLLNLKDLKRKTPLTSLEQLKTISLRGTTTVFEAYRLYRCLLFFFEGHFMLKKSEKWRERTLAIFKRHSARLRETLSAFNKKATFIKGLPVIRNKLGQQIPALDLYTEEMANAFALISFRHCVSILHILELALIELLQINPGLARKSGFLTPTDVPPFNDIASSVRVAALQDQISFAVEICNATTDLDKYDIEHMKKYPASSTWIMSPSYFYQTLIFLAANPSKYKGDDGKVDAKTTPSEKK